MSHQPAYQSSLSTPLAVVPTVESSVCVRPPTGGTSQGESGRLDMELISRLVQDAVRAELAKDREVQEKLLALSSKLSLQLQELLDEHASQSRRGHASPHPPPTSNPVAARPKLPLAVIRYGNTEENLVRMCTGFLLERGVVGHYLRPEVVDAPEEAHELVLLVVKSLTERKPKPSEVAAFIEDKCKGKLVVVVWVRHGDRPEVLQAIEKPGSSYVALELWYTNYGQLRLADTERNDAARTRFTEALLLSSVGVPTTDQRSGAQTPPRPEEKSVWRKFSLFS